MNKFECLHCGSSELSFVKWVKCEDKLFINTNDLIEYYHQQIDDMDMLGVECRFVCGTCKKPLLLHDMDVITEDNLRCYLKMTLDERVEMQTYYDKQAEIEGYIEPFDPTLDSDD